MRGAGGTLCRFWAHQNNLCRGRRNNEIRCAAPNRQTRQQKAAQANHNFQAPMPLRPTDHPRSSAAPNKKLPGRLRYEETTPAATKINTKSPNQRHQHSPDQPHHSHLSLENKMTGEQPTDSQKGSQIRRSKGGDKFPTSYSKEKKGNT